MAEFEHDGWRLSYTDHGGDGPAVLLLHGLLFDRTMFDPQVKLSSEVVSELQGFIESAKGKPLPWSDARICERPSTKECRWWSARCAPTR